MFTDMGTDGTEEQSLDLSERERERERPPLMRGEWYQG